MLRPALRRTFKLVNLAAGFKIDLQVRPALRPGSAAKSGLCMSLEIVESPVGKSLKTMLSHWRGWCCGADFPTSIGGQYTHSSVDGDESGVSVRDSNIVLDDSDKARCTDTKPKRRLGVGANGGASTSKTHVTSGASFALARLAGGVPMRAKYAIRLCPTSAEHEPRDGRAAPSDDGLR